MRKFYLMIGQRSSFLGMRIRDGKSVLYSVLDVGKFVYDRVGVPENLNFAL